MIRRGPRSTRGRSFGGSRSRCLILFSPSANHGIPSFVLSCLLFLFFTVCAFLKSLMESTQGRLLCLECLPVRDDGRFRNNTVHLSCSLNGLVHLDQLVGRGLRRLGLRYHWVRSPLFVPELLSSNFLVSLVLRCLCSQPLEVRRLRKLRDERQLKWSWYYEWIPVLAITP